MDPGPPMERARKRRRTHESSHNESDSDEPEYIHRINDLRDTLVAMKTSLQQFAAQQNRKFGELETMLSSMEKREYDRQRKSVERSRIQAMQAKRGRTASMVGTESPATSSGGRPEAMAVSAEGIERPLQQASTAKVSFMEQMERCTSTDDLPPYPELSQDEYEEGYTPPTQRESPSPHAVLAPPNVSDPHRPRLQNPLFFPPPSLQPARPSPDSPLQHTRHRHILPNALSDDQDLGPVKQESSDDGDMIRPAPQPLLGAAVDGNQSISTAPQRLPTNQSTSSNDTFTNEDPSSRDFTIPVVPSTPVRQLAPNDGDAPSTVRRRNPRTKNTPEYNIRTLSMNSVAGEDSSSQAEILEKILLTSEKDDGEYVAPFHAQKQAGSTAKKKKPRPPKSAQKPKEGGVGRGAGEQGDGERASASPTKSRGLSTPIKNAMFGSGASPRFGGKQTSISDFLKPGGGGGSGG